MADLPWSVRMSFGLLIGVIALYTGILFLPHNDITSKPLEHLQEWTLDAIKAVFGAVVAILGHAAGIEGETRTAERRGGDGSSTVQNP